MTMDLQQHHRMWQGIALEEDLYGRMATSLMPLFHAQAFVAYVRRRPDRTQPWGPATIAFHRGFDPAALDSCTPRPQDIFQSMTGVVTGSDTCQVKLSLVRGAPADPFNDEELRLAEQLMPLLQGAISAQLLLQEARDAARHAQAKFPPPQPWTDLNLTRAETDVLDLLLQGYGVKQISQRRHSSYHTVRSQLASLLSKTNCHSQRELILRMKMH